MSRFKILWIDDQPQKCKRDRLSVERIIEDLGFEPDIDFVSEISVQSLTTPDGDLYKKIHGRDIDLYIVDYNLSDDLFGNSVISEIRRENDIYSDVIFYSSMKSELIKSVKDSYDSPDSANYLDGVYIAPMDDFFLEKVGQVINKIVKSWYNIHSIRGVILSKSSKFENMVSNIIKMGYRPCLEGIAADLNKKAKNVTKNTTSRWKKVTQCQDPVPYILNDSINFNWTVKKIILKRMNDDGLINVEKYDDLVEIFNLRNNFAHNPLHFDNGKLKLDTAKGPVYYTEDSVADIRTKLLEVERDLQHIEDSLKAPSTDNKLATV